MPGPWELAIILAIVLVVFGAGKLPEIGSSLGKGLRSFKKGVSGKDDDIAAEDEDSQHTPAKTKDKV